MGKLAPTIMIHELEIEGYERVVEIVGLEVGLRAIIAIHNTRLGPALGGIRALPYASFDLALNDALRLAKGMTYKAAIAQTGTGGGKSVIIIDNKLPKSEELLFAFAEAVNQFQGQYICAEDVGILVSDLGVIHKKTPFAVGLPHSQSSGDPSRFTAFGGFRGIQAVCKKLWGNDSVCNRKIAIQGLGMVGMKLANFLFWEGAELIVTDVDSGLVAQAVKEFNAKAVHPKEILFTECDILAPCALGAILNSETIPQLRCKAVAGLANNQLFSEEDGQALAKRDILYAPDYVINGGGLLNVCVELEPEGYHPSIARTYVTRIYNQLIEIFDLAEKRRASTHQVAQEIAEHNLKHGIGKRKEEIVFRGLSQ